MKILLDTYILIWLIADDSRLKETARSLLQDEDNEFFYSAISVWEIAIKQHLHPDEFTFSLDQLIQIARESDVQFLPLLETHALTWGSLQMKGGEPEHKDPFDRILVCQAISEGMKFMTHDSKIPLFDTDCVIEV